GFVDINNEKMSKSLGNFTMIKEVLATYSSEVIRMFLLSKHYRSPIDYTEDSMREIFIGLDRIYAFLARVEKAGCKVDGSRKGDLWNNFSNAMNDDFNSAKALASIFEAVKKGNKLLDDADEVLDEGSLETLNFFYNDIKAISNILGMFLLDPQSYFKAKKDRGMTDMAIDPAEIEELIQQRTAARKNKDFSRADEIRDLLQAKNIVLEDGPEGTTWRFE
ncbi:MAG: class I tRNA ligase family protein, partial [Desulfobacula sp.]|nr:class I tRNA ligase family protein [Desulfobacula sp.]